MQQRVLEMIASGDDLETMLTALCRSLEGTMPDARCAILLLEDGGERVQRSVAPGLPPSLSATLEGAAFDVDHLQPARAAADEIAAADLAIAPGWGERRALAAPHGLRACWSLPIRDRRDGEAAGVVAVFHPGPTAPDAAAAALLRRIAAIAALVIRHDRRVAALRQAETRYRTLVEQLPAVTYIEHPVGDVDLYLSPQIEPMLGYAAADVVAGKPAWKDLVHPDDRHWVEAAVRRSDAAGTFDEVYRMIARDGSVVWIRNQAVLVEGDQSQPSYWHGVVIDLTERMLAEERLAYLAHHDALTGLPNRTRFMERLDAALARARQHGDSIAVLFIDLDGFKILNDSLGHDAGDRVLVEAAARLRAALPPADTLARFGGDEFVVLAEAAADAAAAGRVADRLLATLRAPWTIDGCAAQVSGSIGVALLDGRDRAVEPDDLLREADLALYEAKSAGRATRVVYAPRSASADVGKRWPHERRRSMPAREAIVRYRPEVDLASGQIVRLDAVAFWDRLDGGWFPPASFIQRDGATGGAEPTGSWLLREACREARGWGAIAGGAPGLSVHLSVHEFCRLSLPREIAGAMADAGLDPGRLEIRIAESTAAIVAKEIVAQVRALGATVAIDDFGKRDVPVGVLRRLDIDGLWLDASIVAGLDRDQRSLTTARIVTAVGRDARLAIGANGVATAAQADALRRLGVARAQGDAFSPPICARTVAALLASGSASRTPARRA
ncbi:MAG TPA: diguanylate cyclase [Thermomicrobiales bacterium]|nr:diguanylate cyclase [Thermomicrobiales bacterium]